MRFGEYMEQAVQKLDRQSSRQSSAGQRGRQLTAYMLGGSLEKRRWPGLSRILDIQPMVQQTQAQSAAALSDIGSEFAWEAVSVRWESRFSVYAMVSPNTSMIRSGWARYWRV
jgi:hypothetical protein